MVFRICKYIWVARFSVKLEFDIWTKVLAHSIKTELLLEVEKNLMAFSNLVF